MTDDARESAPRPVASVWLFRHSQVLMLQRPDGAWAPPGGMVELDETPLQAAVRETFEETGLQIPADPEALHDYVWAARRLHVHQFIALAPDGDVSISDEHRDYRWIELDVLEVRLSQPGVANVKDSGQLLPERQVAVGRARDWLGRHR